MNIKRENDTENRQLDKDLDEIGRVYSQAGREEPPELLDLAIRNSAHRAVEKQPRQMKFGWLHGLTTAAVFVLALSVVIHQRENRPAAGNEMQFHPAPTLSPSKKQKLPAESAQDLGKLEESADTGLGRAAAEALTTASEPTVEETLRDNRQKVSAAQIPQSDEADIDKDQPVLEKAIEAKEDDKHVPENMAVATEGAWRDTSAKPAIVAAPPPAEAEARSDSNEAAETQLQAIVRMKRTGEGDWKAALKTFVEKYPDYPLPDELKD